MEYPTFDLPVFGGSLLIACVAIFHVFIAQFSVGAGVMMVLAERRAIRQNDSATLEFLRRYSLAVLLAPYVAGALSGVGIWFVTGVVNPRAISAMIHLFVWAWAAEWVMFIVDVIAAYLYFYTFGRIRPAAHNAIGWILVGSSVTTLVIINAIISFMLTPGSWTPGGEGAFFKGLLNPSFWPTTIERILVSLALAGAGAVLLLALRRREDEGVRRRVTALAYRLMLPCLLCVPLAVWAIAVIPARAQAFLAGSAIAMGMFFAMGLTCFLILAVAAIVAMARREYSPSALGAVMLVLLAFIAYGAFEFVREGIRKPYVVEGYMYSTGVTTSEALPGDRAAMDRTRREGVLAASPWASLSSDAPAAPASVERGRAVYQAACAACHQPYVGYNALRPVVRGWTPVTIRRYLDSMHEQRPMMPPFPGTDAEKDALTAYIATMTEANP